MQELKIGDVVQMKSGGPHMVIVAEGNIPNYVFCEWQVATDWHKLGDQFHKDSLTKIDG